MKKILFLALTYCMPCVAMHTNNDENCLYTKQNFIFVTIANKHIRPFTVKLEAHGVQKLTTHTIMPCNPQNMWYKPSEGTIAIGSVIRMPYKEKIKLERVNTYDLAINQTKKALRVDTYQLYKHTILPLSVSPGNKVSIPIPVAEVTGPTTHIPYLYCFFKIMIGGKMYTRKAVQQTLIIKPANTAPHIAKQ